MSSSRIVYITPTGQLATVAPDGGAQRTLTRPGRFFQFPAWSPDGALIAVVGSDRQGGAVYVVTDEPVEQGGVRLCFAGPNDMPFYVFWAPNGTSISFLSYQQNRGMNLQTVSPNGAGARVLVRGQPCFWAWAPDSTRLLVHTGAQMGESSIAFVAPDGEQLGVMQGIPGLFQAPGIAASGLAWAFGEVSAAGETRIVVDYANGAERIVLPHEGVVTMSWSPTRDQLAFLCPTLPTQHWYGPLRLLNLGTELVRVLVDADVLAFFWSPDGRTIAYFTVGGAANPHLAYDGGSRNGVYKNSQRPPQPPATRTPTEHGLDLVVIDVVSGAQRLLHSFTPVPLFLDQFLPFFDQYALSHRLWAPDSSGLVLPVLSEGQPRILVVPADGSPVRAVADGIMAFWSPR